MLSVCIFVSCPSLASVSTSGNGDAAVAFGCFVVRLLRFSAKSAVVACGCLPHICRSLVFGCVWFGSVLWCPYRREFRWLCCCLYAAGNRNSNHNIVIVIVIEIEIASCFPLINHSVILSTCFPISLSSLSLSICGCVCALKQRICRRRRQCVYVYRLYRVYLIKFLFKCCKNRSATKHDNASSSRLVYLFIKENIIIRLQTPFFLKTLTLGELTKQIEGEKTKFKWEGLQSKQYKRKRSRK